MMGLGNLACAQKDYAKAATYFARDSRAHPDNGDPLSNLAQALLTAGDLPATRDTIAEAIRIGKPHPGVHRKTLEQIEDASQR